MKKSGLFKIIMGALLLTLVLTYVIPGSTGTRSFLATGDVFVNYIYSFYNFFEIFVFVLLVGGLYAVLNLVPAYKKILDKIVNKYRKNSKYFIISVIIIFAVLATLTGITIPMFVIIPFVISIILLLGYDKLVAISATIGATLIGSMSAILATFRSSAGVPVTFEELLSLEKFSNMWVRIILFVLTVGLLIFFVLRHINKKETKKYDLSNEDTLLEETKVVKKSPVWPLVTILCVLVGFMILGYFPFEQLFGWTIWNDIHTWITSLKIGEFSLWNNIVSARFPSFGNWSTLGSYMMLDAMIVISIVLIKFIYKIKWSNIMEIVLNGMKKILPTALLSVLAYTVLICSYTNGFMYTLTNTVNEWTKGFNTVTGSIMTMFDSAFYIDIYYVVGGGFSGIINLVEDTSTLPVLSIMFSSLYYLVMLFAPTSILLILGLSYLNVPYKTWLKYIWRLLLCLFLVVFAVMSIMLLI